MPSGMVEASECAPDGQDDGRPGIYEPPTIQRLGTLEELTLGGVVGPDDGLGGAGDAS